MRRFIFVLLIVLFTSPLYPPLEGGKAAAQVPYRIRLSDSTYTAQLRGVVGTRTASEAVNGAWSTTYKLHEFDVTVTGRYRLYVDPAGGLSYVLVSSWGKTNGKHIPGYDQATFWENISGSTNQLLSTGIGDTSISNAKLKADAVTTAKITDSTVTMPKLSTTVHAAMGEYGAGTYPPDDVELEFQIIGSDTSIEVKDSWITALVRDSVIKARTWANEQTFNGINNIKQAADYSAARYTTLQEAIDSVVAKNYKYLYVPRGVYWIDTTITITTDSLTIEGEGILSVIKLASLANVDQMFMLDSCRFVTFEGLTFDNNEANQTGGEIRCIQTQDSVYNLKIKDCIFDGNGRIAASGSNGIYLYNCYDSIINNIYVDGWTRHDFMVLGYCDNIIVRNSTFKNLSTAGIILISEVENTIITNNFFDSIGDSSLGRGHAVTSNTFQTANEDLWPDKIIISNNICDGCFGDVIHVEHGFRFVICGNIIRSFFVTAADSTGDTGISCSAEQSVIFGNHVSGNAAPGITLFNNPKYATGYNMIAIGNSIFNNGIHTVSSPQRNGIWLDDVQRCIVACNNSSDNIDTQTYGVYSSGTSKYNIIANNMLSFNQTRPLHFTSDSLDNIIFGNMEWQDGAATPDSTRGSSFWQHGDIDAGDFGGHKTAYTFYVDNIQDSVTTATQMESDGSEAKGYRMVYAGSVVGIVVAISGTQSAGTLTAEAYVNNAQTGLVATISTAVDAASSTQRMDIDTIAAEAALSVKYTTSNDWAPEDVDLYVTVIVEQ